MLRAHAAVLVSCNFRLVFIFFGTNATMRKMILIVSLLLLISLALVYPATSCSADAYRRACATCPFDKSGKIDRSCMDGFRASGIACVSSSYPIMSAKYSAGECPAVDACASELQSCVAHYSTGNDKADCQEGSVSVCYTASDHCVAKAAINCGEIEKDCPGSSLGLIIMVLAILGMAAARRYI